jgi:hypothetical protein
MMKEVSSLRSQKGIGLVEVLVSIFIFSIAIVSIAAFNRLTFGNLGAENRISSSMRELKNAVGLLSAELRMSASISPYLPGNLPAVVNCLTSIQSSNNSISFLVVHDDSAADDGIQPYHVGYTYNSDTHQLLRGEIPGITTRSCLFPGGDPTSSQIAKVIADRVYPRDINGDGIAEPIFSYANGILDINLSVEAPGPKGFERNQGVSTRIYTRSYS